MLLRYINNSFCGTFDTHGDTRFLRTVPQVRRRRCIMQLLRNRWPPIRRQNLILQNFNTISGVFGPKSWRGWMCDVMWCKWLAGWWTCQHSEKCWPFEWPRRFCVRVLLMNSNGFYWVSGKLVRLRGTRWRQLNVSVPVFPINFNHNKLHIFQVTLVRK